MEAASRGERVGCLAPLRAPANGRARGPARWSTRRPGGEDLVGSGSLTGSGRRWDRSLCRFNPKFAKKSGDFPPTGIPGVGAGGQRGTPVGSSGWARRCARAPTPCVGPSAAASRCHASRLRARREASAGTGARRRGVGRIGGRSAARRGRPGGPARGPSGRRVGLARGQSGRPVGLARGPSGRPVGPSRRTSCSSCTRAPRGADRAVGPSVRRGAPRAPRGADEPLARRVVGSAHPDSRTVVQRHGCSAPRPPTSSLPSGRPVSSGRPSVHCSRRTWLAVLRGRVAVRRPTCLRGPRSDRPLRLSAYRAHREAAASTGRPAYRLCARIVSQRFSERYRPSAHGTTSTSRWRRAGAGLSSRTQRNRPVPHAASTASQLSSLSAGLGRRTRAYRSRLSVHLCATSAGHLSGTRALVDTAFRAFRSLHRLRAFRSLPTAAKHQR